MRLRLFALLILPLGALGCSEPASQPVVSPTPPAYVVPPPTAAPLRLAVAAEECTRLIGSINAGVAHVDAMGTSASSEGKDEFEVTAQALEAVARAVSETTYYTPDLARLGGFYVGIAKAQGGVIREIGRAIDSGDANAVHAGEGKLELLAKQEDALVLELNQLCRGGAAPAQARGAAEDTPAPAPSATPSDATPSSPR